MSALFSVRLSMIKEATPSKVSSEYQYHIDARSEQQILYQLEECEYTTQNSTERSSDNQLESSHYMEALYST